MPFNLRGPRRARELAEQTRLMTRLERSMTRRTRRELTRTATAAAKAYTAGRSAGLDQVFNAHQDGMARLLDAHHRGTMGIFGKRILEAAKASRAALERKAEGDVFDMAVEDWIARYTALKVTQITRTTRKRIIDAIARLEGERLGVDQIARGIVKETGGAIARARAAVIARTETHQAAMYANDAAARATGIPGLRREWMAANDERTRETHAAADGQIVGMDEPFIVGGVPLTRPGDPDGPPDLVVNCRCVQAFISPGYE